jgi:hypothetical protein
VLDFDRGLGQQFSPANEKAQFQESAIDALVPLKISDKTAILMGTLLEQTRISIAPNTQALFYGTMLKLGVNLAHSDRWSGTYLLLPKLSSDLKKVGQKDIQFGGLVLIKYSPSNHFNYRFGFYANSDLFGPMLVPIFGIYLLKNKWEISSALPINADISYLATPKNKLGLRFAGINKSYWINNGMNQYMEKVNNELGLYYRFIQKNIQLQVLAGYSLGRKFKTYEENDKMALALSAIKFDNNRTQINQHFSDGIIGKVSLVYRISTAKSDPS